MKKREKRGGKKGKREKRKGKKKEGKRRKKGKKEEKMSIFSYNYGFTVWGKKYDSGGGGGNMISRNIYTPDPKIMVTYFKGKKLLTKFHSRKPPV